MELKQGLIEQWTRNKLGIDGRTLWLKEALIEIYASHIKWFINYKKYFIYRSRAIIFYRPTQNWQVGGLPEVQISLLTWLIWRQKDIRVEH